MNDNLEYYSASSDFVNNVYVYDFKCDKSFTFEVCNIEYVHEILNLMY